MESREQLRLVKKAVKGNADAYGKLISEYQDYLYKVAWLYMKQEEDALDVVGTTILKAYQNIHGLKDPNYFKTWLTKILINTAQNEKKKIIYYMDLNDIQVSGRYDSVSLEEKCDLNMAIERLTEKYRTVVILKYFSGLSVKEIAFVMSIPEGSVKAYLSRAREELKKILKEDYIDAD